MREDLRRVRTLYTGKVAAWYEHHRQGTSKWQAETAFVKSCLQDVCSVLDCPVGTGRFLPLYKDLGIAALGVDVSADMLAIAQAKGYGRLQCASVFDLQLTETFDLAVSMRFLNWLEPDELLECMKCLAAHAARIVVSIRLRTDEPLSQAAPYSHDLPVWLATLNRVRLHVEHEEVIDHNEFGHYHLVCLKVITPTRPL